MPIEYREKIAVFEGQCALEEVEVLMNWLENGPEGTIDLSRCDGLHGALLQVLIAAQRPVSVPPDDAFLREWVLPVLRQQTRPRQPFLDRRG